MPTVLEDSLLPALQRMRTLTGGSMVWDNHTCMPLRGKDRSFLPVLKDCLNAGVDLVTLPVGYDPQSVVDHIQVLSMFRDWIAQHPEVCRLVLSTGDAEAAKREGKLGVCFDIEGMNAVGDQPDLVRMYYDLGVRWMLIAYNKANAAGGGCMETDDGLTSFGRTVISKMNEVGMVLCCTHAGYRTAREAIDHSSAPVIFSHSNPLGAFNHPRNIPDDLIKACAARGGVIGINGIGLFLGQNDAGADNVVRHIEYVVNLVGDEHVGISTDYCFDQNEGIEAVAKYPELFPPELFPPGIGINMLPTWKIHEVAELLARRGHSRTSIGRIVGGNFWRIAQTVWK
jgi:membrane dipeptidase